MSNRRSMLIKLIVLIILLLAIVGVFCAFLFSPSPAPYDKSMVSLSPSSAIVDPEDTLKITVLGKTDIHYDTVLVNITADPSLTYDSYEIVDEEIVSGSTATELKDKNLCNFAVSLRKPSSELFKAVYRTGKMSFEAKNLTVNVEYLFEGSTIAETETVVSVKNCKDFEEFKSVFKSEFPSATWDTFYVTVLSTLLAFVIGLPLGVLLVVGEKKGIRPIPKPILSILNVIINLLRSVPFLILMILVFPLTRLIIGKAYGTTAMIIPLVIAAFPFVARLIETSLREVNPNVIEAAQSMGASPIQIICKVMIPESVPSLISNLTIALTTILGYSAMSGAIGGGGLGMIAINYGYYRYQTLVMIAAVIVLIILVQIFQCVGSWLAVKCDRRLKK